MPVAVSGEDASEKPETDDEGIEQDSGDGTDDGAVPKVPPFSFDSGPLYAIITKVIEVSKSGAAFRFDPTAFCAFDLFPSYTASACRNHHSRCTKR